MDILDLMRRLLITNECSKYKYCHMGCPFLYE